MPSLPPFLDSSSRGRASHTAHLEPAAHHPHLYMSSQQQDRAGGPSGHGNPDGGPPQPLNQLGQDQIYQLLKHLPGVFTRLVEQGGLKDGGEQNNVPPPVPPPGHGRQQQYDDDDDAQGDTVFEEPDHNHTAGRRRRGQETGDEWARQRKDNHKEVERRRRSNINEGINELSRIVPNGGGEKAKGAILNRAVQYIHQLKENEARNIEKWTLEKLLMDQAMGDLQGQLEDMRRRYEDERMAREKAERDLDRMVAQMASAAANAASANGEDGRPEKRRRIDD